MSESRRNTGLAPLVGALLAAFTVGSLVLFSLVAQRTSLDGLSTRGVTVRDVAGATAGSITLAPTAGLQDGSSSDQNQVDEAVVPLEVIAPTSSLLVAQPTPIPAGTNMTRPGTGAPIVAAPSAPRAPLPGTDGASFSRAEGGTDNAAGADHRGAAPRGHNGSSRSKKEKKARVGRQNGHPAGPPGRASARSPKPSPPARGHSISNGRGHSKNRGNGHQKHH